MSEQAPSHGVHSHTKMPGPITEARHLFVANGLDVYFGDSASRTSFTLALDTAGAALPQVLRT